MADSIKLYHEKRRIIFATYYKHGYARALEYLKGYRKTLGEPGYTGLRAELEYFNSHVCDYKLVVACDIGDRTDFAGCFDSALARVDVTTRWDLKSLRDYEPLMREGEYYKIAIMNTQENDDKWELYDTLNLPLPRCSGCIDSYRFRIVVMLPTTGVQGIGDHIYLELCPSCGEFEHIETSSDCSLHIQEYVDSYAHDEISSHKIAEREQEVYLHLARKHDPLLMGIADYDYKLIRSDGDGSYGIKMRYVHPFVKDYFDDFIETGTII